MKPGFYLLISPWPRSPVPHGAQPAKSLCSGAKGKTIVRPDNRGQREWELRPRSIPSLEEIQVFLSLHQGGSQLPTCQRFALQNLMLTTCPQGGNDCHCGAEGSIRCPPRSSLKGLSGQVVALNLELDSGGIFRPHQLAWPKDCMPGFVNKVLLAHNPAC